MRVPEALADTIAESDLTLIDRTVAAEERRSGESRTPAGT